MTLKRKTVSYTIALVAAIAFATFLALCLAVLDGVVFLCRRIVKVALSQTTQTVLGWIVVAVFVLLCAFWVWMVFARGLPAL